MEIRTLSLDNTIYQNGDKGLYNFTFGIRGMHQRKAEFEFEMSVTRSVAILATSFMCCGYLISCEFLLVDPFSQPRHVRNQPPHLGCFRGPSSRLHPKFPKSG